MKMILSHKTVLALLAALALVCAPACTTTNGGTGEATAAPTDATDTADEAPVSGSGWVESSLYVPTGERGTSALHLSKSAPRQVNLGDTFEIRFAVTNLTDMALENVVINDELPADFRVAKTEPAFEPRDVENGVWNIGTLGPGESRNLVVTGAAAKPVDLSSCTGISYDTSICMTTAVVEPALSIIAEGPTGVLICDEIPIKYTARNSGTGPARNVVVTADYPAGLKDPEGKTSLARSLGTLNAGQTVEFTVVLKADKTGKFETGGHVQANGGLEADAVTVKTTVMRPTLEVEMTGTQRSFLGRRVRYQIEVKNTGDADARDALVSMPIPAGLSFVSATAGGRIQGGAVVWGVSSVDAEGSVAMEAILEGIEAGNYKLKASAQAECAMAADAEVATKVTGIPAILLEVVDRVDPVIVGDNVTYDIVVTNQGTADGTNIKITATMPNGVEFVSASGATAHQAAGDTVTFAALPRLGPKDQAVYRVTVRATESVNSRFRVTLTSNELGDQPVEETEATTFYE